MSSVYKIWTERRNANGEPIFLHFECDVPTIEQFVHALNDGKLILGAQLWVRSAKDDDGSCLEIIRRKVIAIGKAAVASVEIPRDRFVSFEEASP